MAGLFQVLYGKADGSFRKAEVLNCTDGEPLIIPVKQENWTENICTRPFAVDWDADGDLDLVVGNFDGTFFWFAGEGKGKFGPKPEPINTGNKLLKINGNHSDPFVIDWDGDGDLDLLSGSSSGGVQWSENIAGAGRVPELRPFEELIEPGHAPEFGQLLKEDQLSAPSHATRVWAADVNGDGKLDLLVGDNVTLISPAKGVSEEDFKEQAVAWKKSFDDAMQEMSSGKLDAAKRAKAQEEFRKIYDKRTEFMNEEPTGFVWLYLRK